jgi:galactitol-specific phosphotransferase system IIB component
MSKVTLKCQLVGIHKTFIDEEVKGLDGQTHLSITGKFVARGTSDRHNNARVFRVNARFDTYELTYELLKAIADAEEGKAKADLIDKFNTVPVYINKAVRNIPLYFVHDVKVKGEAAQVRYFRPNHPTLKDHPILASTITEYWFDHDEADSEDKVCEAKATQIINADMFVSDDTIEEYLGKDMPKITNSNVKKKLNDAAAIYKIENAVDDVASSIMSKTEEVKELSQKEIDAEMAREAAAELEKK